MKELKAPREPENSSVPEDPAFRRYFYDEVHRSEFSGLAGMNRREQEELLLMSGNRKQRKAIKARRKAREQAMKQGKQD